VTPYEREAIQRVLEDHHPTGELCDCCGTYSCSCLGRPSAPTTFDVRHVMEEIDKVVTTE